MRHVIKWNNFLREGVDNFFYILFDELIHVNNIQRWGDEIKVEYEKENGEKFTYIGDDKDFREDFIDTNNKFELNSLPKPKHIKKEEPKSIIEPEQKYNLVYYIGKKDMGFVSKDLTKKLAYALKNTLSKEPKYSSGRIEVEKVK